MQNNNSKSNTILLVVLIILAGICVWKLSYQKNNHEGMVWDSETKGWITIPQAPSNQEQADISQSNHQLEAENEKPVTYSFPALGGVVPFTYSVMGDPNITTSTFPTKVTLSGDIGTDSMTYSLKETGGANIDPCGNSVEEVAIDTYTKKYGLNQYEICSKNGNTYFYTSGVNSQAVVVTSSGENRVDAHYVDLGTILFTN